MVEKKKESLFSSFDQHSRCPQFEKESLLDIALWATYSLKHEIVQALLNAKLVEGTFEHLGNGAAFADTDGLGPTVNIFNSHGSGKRVKG